MKIPKEWKIAVKNYLPVCGAMVSSFINLNPSLAYAMYSAIGLYGVYMDANQEELNNFLVFIKDHPDVFVEEAISTNDFKKGFVITLGEFLKMRSEHKRETVKRVFLGFTSSKNKENFQLEKLYSVLSSISFESIQYLEFISNDILQVAKLACRKEMTRVKILHENYNVELGEINFKLNNPLTKFIRKNLDDQFGINNEKAKEKYAHIEDSIEQINAMDKDMKSAEKLLNERVSELISLGILRAIIDDSGVGVIGGGSVCYKADFTDFGLDFLSYLNQS